MERWTGKVALVTGASAGIGAAVVEELVKNGLQVIGLARRVDRVEKLKEKLNGAKGELHPLKADVGIEKDLQEAFDFIKKTFGKIHVLVNNAGIVRPGMIVDGNLDDFKDIINVNVVGLLSITQKTLQLMKETGINDGHIINISSVVGHYLPQLEGNSITVYAASKHTVRALTEGVRQELRYLKLNTKISSISPGVVDSEFGQASIEGTKGPKVTPTPEMMKAFESLPKLQSKDIADAVVYVLQTPPHVQIHELMIRPVGEPF